MLTIKQLFIFLFVINLFPLLLLLISKSEVLNESTPTESGGFLEPQLENYSPYKFENPELADLILSQLDIYEVVENKVIRAANYSSSGGGFKINNNYCNEHRTYFINHPEMVFDEINIATNYWHHHKLRSQVIPAMDANDVHPEIFHRSASLTPLYKYDMSPRINIFYMFNLYFYYKQIGKQFSCLSQASNHIPGHELIYRKDYGAQALVDYAATYKKRPECFNYDQFFPKTWVLRNKAQCKDFFEKLNGEEYPQLKAERKIVYFRKIGADVHEGKGVFPVNDAEENYLRKLYQNGRVCGYVRENNLIQYNVYNPFLLENRKFGIRMFLLIASSNPVIAYYHDGYLRLSLDEYNPNSNETRTFVTNIGVSLKEAQKEKAFTGMTEEQIQEYTLWYFDKFHKYLMDNGYVQDPNWLDNYLRPQLKKAMVHLIRMSQSFFFKKSSVFELYGLDFVVDANLGIWYIETNTMPLVNGFTKESTKQLNQMLIDVHDIVMGLIRSRMKRVINFINQITREMDGMDVEEGVFDLESKKKEFRELTRNKFETEFLPRKNNTFQLIIDENKQGTERYGGLLSEDCL